MDNNMLYWLIEYGKVLFGYGFLMFVWPLTIFRKYLKNKSVTVKFGFCVTGQVVLVNTVVIIIGLLQVLNDWTLRILFYGSFLYSIRHCFALTKERKTKIKYLVHGSFGVKNLIWLEYRKYTRKLENVSNRFWIFYKKHWLEYSLLVIAVIYGVVYFSWGAFHDRSYGFSDMYVHHEWIYQLSEGKPFSSGIYPEGMHCIIYALNALFGIRIYSCILFSSLVNIIAIMLAIYCLFKEIFKWRFSAVLTLMIFLTFGGVKGSVVTCMSRLQCALPQEFAFPGVFLCAAFLIRYLKSCRGTKMKGRIAKWYWNDNLLVFTLAFTSTIVIHFYATFMAFFLCLGVAVCLIKRVLKKERFLPLVASVIVGLVVAITPMVAAFATGIPLQGSLYWAMSVMSVPSGETNENVPEVNTPIQESPEPSGTVNVSEFVDSSETEKKPVGVPAVVSKEEKISFIEKIELFIECCKETGTRIWTSSEEIGKLLYYVNFVTLYDEKIADVSVWIHIIVLTAGVFGLFLKTVVGKLFCLKRVQKIDCTGYMMGILASFIYIIVYCSPELGLPVLLDKTRVCAIVFLLNIAVAVSVFDMLFYLGNVLLPESVLSVISLGIIAWVIGVIAISEYYHGYLYFALTRFDSTVQLTNQIIDELPEESFTIVSPTEELYQVIEYGYHEELITFLENQTKDSYTLPTEYVFVYVEKKPLQYVQLHSFIGPEWLAGDSYHEVMYQNFGSTWPEYSGSSISKEEEEKTLMRFSKLSDMYSQLASRTIIESKIYYWCERFINKYPNEVKVLYEDDYLVCYYWKQNSDRPYNLVIE